VQEAMKRAREEFQSSDESDLDPGSKGGSARLFVISCYTRLGSLIACSREEAYRYMRLL
jgi:hypothetical protein